MYLCKVIGSVWGSKQVDGLVGMKLLECAVLALPGADGDTSRVTAEECPPSGEILVAADSLGAGPGETVIVTKGSRARDIAYGTKAPIKAFVLAIVDSADIHRTIQEAP